MLIYAFSIVKAFITLTFPWIHRFLIKLELIMQPMNKSSIFHSILFHKAGENLMSMNMQVLSQICLND